MVTLRFMGIKIGVVAFNPWWKQHKDLSVGIERSVQNHLPEQKSIVSV